MYAETLRALAAFDHDLAVEAAEDLGRAYRRRYQHNPAPEEVDPRVRPGDQATARGLGGQTGNGIRPGQADHGNQAAPGPTGHGSDATGGSGEPDPPGKPGKAGKRGSRRRKRGPQH